MKKFYLQGLMLVSFLALTSFAIAQSCAGFGATAVGYESRCAATGSIKITASGGSGDYSYKVTGPITTNFTSTDSITGLSAGTYIVTVQDITKNCTFNLPHIIVPGIYNDPRFTLLSTDVTCDNGSNGSIQLNTVTNGLAPFEFSIIAPSPMGIGTTNSTGTFTDLSAGIYTIRLTDSCGGIQTRLVTINNYRWQIDSFVFRKISCDSAQGYIRVSDNKGNVSTITGLPGFEYGIVRSPGDTILSTDPNFTFYLSGENAFEIIVKDPCGNVKKSSLTLTFRSSLGNSVHISNNSCNTYNVSLTNILNFSNPSFCLLDNNGVELECNTTGSFINLSYGDYCINAYDSCSDTTIVRCFTLAPTPASVGTNVAVSNKTCYSFTAAITGQIGLTNPNYCLYDSLDNELACNSTGVFNNLAYAYYCIKVKDSCRDTTITRCFYPERPTPYIPDVISPGYYTCNNFGVVVRGDSLTNPRFCIVDINGDTLTCNTTGVFDSLAYGYYCVVVHDDCYDTTINRCFTVGGPVFNGVLNVNTSNQNCSGFTATVVGQGFVNPEYCLYTDAGVLVSCDSSGIFTGLPYGTYYVTAKNECPDTTVIKYFSEQAPWPLVDANVAQTDKTCGSFTAAITGQQNLTNPSYCLYDHNDTLIACNSTGIFTGLAYDSYCIKVKDGCFDTTLVRCFTATPNPINLTVKTYKSCAYGYAKFNFTISGGTVPLNVKIYNPDSTLLLDKDYNYSSINIDSITGTMNGEKYRIVVTDFCGSIDTAVSSAIASVFSRLPKVVPMCPSSTWVNGSGSIETEVQSNTGSVTVRIIKKDNTSLSLSPSTVWGGVYSFNNLGPATYIVKYSINDVCGNIYYDTITVKPYEYPNLSRSSAYQCDQNGFSVGAVVSDGIGPFTYEIIGSTPASPSIITTPQSSPVFNIDNGTAYTLVRLRALDACGNASLQDASILPLANNGITATFNCFQLNSTLSVDTLNNAQYAWYHKYNSESNDSTFVDSSFSIYLPYVLPADTGIYICNINVYNGCINRWYYYHLNGECYQYLQMKLENFSGSVSGRNAVLNWDVPANPDIQKFVVERKNGSRGFMPIGSVFARGDNAKHAYYFIDSFWQQQKSFYRLKMVDKANNSLYSKEVIVAPIKQVSSMQVYPNPAMDLITVEFNPVTGHQYKIQLVSLTSQVVKEIDYNGNRREKVEIRRNNTVSSGVYIVKVIDVNTNEELTQKVIFR